MYINDYGEKDKPLVILLAPMMVSGTDLYELIHPYLKGEYHIIAPDQGAMGKPVDMKVLMKSIDS